MKLLSAAGAGDGERGERAHAACVPGRKMAAAARRTRAPRPSGARDPSPLPQWPPPPPPARPPRPGVRASAQASATVHVDGGGSPPRPSVGRHSSPAAAPPPRASGPAPPPPQRLSLGARAPPTAPAEPTPEGGGRFQPAGPAWRPTGLGRARTKPLPQKAPWQTRPASASQPAGEGFCLIPVAPHMLKKRSEFWSF